MRTTRRSTTLPFLLAALVAVLLAALPASASAAGNALASGSVRATDGSVGLVACHPSPGGLYGYYRSSPYGYYCSAVQIGSAFGGSWSREGWYYPATNAFAPTGATSFCFCAIHY